jgi:flavin-dependent dehydrogenase
MRSVRIRTLDRFALVGDSAGYIDAITGEGLTLAFRSAAVLGKLLPEALERGATQASLIPYEEAASSYFRRYAVFTQMLLLLARYPVARTQVLRALARFPVLFKKMLHMVVEG